MAIWIFESQKECDWARTLRTNPGSTQLISLPELWKEQGWEAPKSSTVCFHEFRKFVPAPLPLPFHAYFQTIGELRKVGVLSEDDEALVFSLLPKTPKNSLLSTLMRLYRESSLNQDEAHFLRRSHENRRALLSSYKSITWIESDNPSPLFRILTENDPRLSLRNLPVAEEHKQDCRLSSFWIQSKNAQAMRRAVELLNKKKEGAASLLVFAQLSLGQQYLLESLLIRQCFAVYNELPRPTWDASAAAQTWQEMRSSQEQPLKFRLEASHRFRLQGNRREEPSTFLHSPSPHSPSLKATIPSEPNAHNKKVFLYPFQSAPLLDQAFSLGLFYPDAHQSENEGWVLSRFEIGLLRQHGFQLISQRDAHLRRLATWAETKQANRTFLFSSLPARPDSKSIQIRSPMNESPFDCDKDPLQSLDWTQAQTYSPTSLETYRRCPAQFYFKNRLKLSPIIGASSALNRLVGQVIHRTLDLYWKDQKQKAWSDYFAEALGENKDCAILSPAQATALKANCETMWNHYVKAEKALQELLPGREAVECEKKVQFTLAGRSLMGIIDRMDFYPGNQCVVVDYKTGTIDFTPDHMAKGENFQATIYGLAVEKGLGKSVTGVLFMDLKQAEIRRGVVRESTLDSTRKKLLTRGHAVSEERWTDLFTQSVERILETIQAIESGVFSPTPSREVCSTCDFGNLCRREIGIS